MWQIAPTPANYLVNLPTRETRIVQLGRGSSSVRTLIAKGKHCFAIEVSAQPDSIWTVVPDPDWVGFLMPLSLESEFRFDGWGLSPRNVVFMDGRSDYTTAGARRKIATIVIRRDVLARACANLTATEIPHFGRGHRLIELKNKPNDLHGLIRRAFTAALGLNPRHGALTLPPLHERDLICAIADWLTTRTSTARPVRMTRRDPLRIVEAAKAVIRSDNIGQVSMPDLCAAAGVGKTRLHQCFIDVHGLSPGQYLIRHRLSVARELFLREGKRPALVKQVALQLGFSNSGRFARRYFEAFGEFPHENMHNNAVEP